MTPAPAEGVFDTATATPDLAGMRVSRWSSTSPDGRWVAEFVMAFPKIHEEGYLPMFYTGLIVRSADGKKEWRIIDKWTEEGLGMLYPEPVRWSKDGRSFYYTNDVVPEGCSGVFINGTDLYRVDLENGTVIEILPPHTTRWIEISPDEKTLAYIAREGVVLRDLASGQERTVSIGKMDRSKKYRVKIVWSPDNQFLAVTVAIGACGRVEDGEGTSVVVVDAVSLAVRTIVSEDKRYLVAEEWPESGRLVLKDPQGARWVWSMESGVLAREEGLSNTPIPTSACNPVETPTIPPTETPTDAPADTPTSTPN